MSDHPTKDPIKGSSYEKMKLSDDDKKRVERRFRVNQIKHRRLDVDESSTRLLAKKIIEVMSRGDKS